MARGMQSTAVEDRETTSLIANDKVEGTAVYDADGKHIGKIERLMIDKLTGKVAYAVMSFGGILGIGADHYSIPWSLLRYNKSSAAIKSTSPNSSSRTPRNLAKTRIGTGPAGRARNENSGRRKRPVFATCDKRLVRVHDRARLRIPSGIARPAGDEVLANRPISPSGSFLSAR